MSELPATFGKYFLTEKLATGGMAEIYLGKLVGPGGFEKQLVIKQIHPRLAAEPHFVDLLVAEAKTLVGLTHGNIVPVYELGIVDDTYFIAMEYIDGPTLWQFTEAVWGDGARISPPVAAWIAAEILDGLDYAHRKGEGVIHRDLSPRNVMLSRDGQVLIVDFGIAVPFGQGDDAEADGAPTGSFPYMSPEQVQRKRLTTASDLFSASVLLWEMLAGQRLFARSGADATLDAVLHAEIPPPSTFCADVPPKLDEAVLRGLERAPEDRWASAGELLAAINRYLYSLDAPPTARELTTLVARHNPPVVTRPDVDEPADDHATHANEIAPGGTVVVPRKSAERRAAEDTPIKTIVKVREQSFATHVEIERVFGQTKSLPILVESKSPLIRWGPPILLAMILAAIAVVLMMRPSDSAAPIDAAPVVVVSPDARQIDAAPPAPLDAAPLADAEPPPIDAGRPIRVDGGLRPPPRDAGPPIDAAPRPIDAAVATATGTVKVGANPWGKVSIDGDPKGNAPGAWKVPVGKHEVVVTFPEPEQRQTFHVDVSAGEIESVFAEFEQ